MIRCSKAPLMATLALLLAACTTTGTTPVASEPTSQAQTDSVTLKAARVHTELAAAYFQQGNMAVALEELRVAVMADSSYAPAYNMRGLVHAYLHERDAAEQSFRQAASLAPGDPEVSNNYGWFLCEIGKPDEAFRQFTAAMKNPLYPTPEKSYINAGQCAMKVKNLPLADEYLEKALRLGRNRPAVLFQVAQLRFLQEDFESAKLALDDMHRLGEPNAESLWLAIRTARRLGDRHSEAGLTAQLRRNFPDSKEVREMKRGYAQ